jgi:hypothetical protein
MYGFLEGAQAERVATLIAGRTVWALGSGSDMQEAHRLASLGAATVYAVDKAHRERLLVPTFERARVDRAAVYDCRAYFVEFETHVQVTGLPNPDVAFLKWPTAQRHPGLLQLLKRAGTVIYVGRNDGITACGGTLMWEHLRTRTLLEVVEGPRNDMLVYGGGGEYTTIPRCREEHYALRTDTTRNP